MEIDLEKCLDLLSNYKSPGISPYILYRLAEQNLSSNEHFVFLKEYTNMAKEYDEINSNSTLDNKKEALKNSMSKFIRKYYSDGTENVDNKKSFIDKLLDGLGISEGEYEDFKKKHGNFVTTILMTESHATTIIIDLRAKSYYDFKNLLKEKELEKSPIMIFDSSHTNCTRMLIPSPFIKDFINFATDKNNIMSLVEEKSTFSDNDNYVVTYDSILTNPIHKKLLVKYILINKDKEKKRMLNDKDIKERLINRILKERYDNIEEKDKAETSLPKYIDSFFDEIQEKEDFEDSKNYPYFFDINSESVKLINPRLQHSSSCSFHALSVALAACSLYSNVEDLKKDMGINSGDIKINEENFFQVIFYIMS